MSKVTYKSNKEAVVEFMTPLPYDWSVAVSPVGVNCKQEVFAAKKPGAAAVTRFTVTGPAGKQKVQFVMKRSYDEKPSQVENMTFTFE